MDHSRSTLFEDTPIPKAVWRLALPTMTGMLVTVLYNLVDTFFVGQTGDTNQVAAVSLALPMFFILLSIGNLFGIGASSVISRALGAKDFARVGRASSFAFWGALSLACVLGSLFFIFMPQLVQAVGADPLSAPHVSGYLSWVSLGCPFIVLSACMTYLVRSEGSAKAAMLGVMIGTVANIALDPLFIFTFGYGVEGAAIATVLANIFSSAYLLIVILRGRRQKRSHLSLSPRKFSLQGGIARAVLAIGVPASLSNILMSFSIVIYNLFLSDYGNDPLAAMGIVMKVISMYIMVVIGLSQGVQPLFGYCFGAGRYERLKQAVRYTMLTSVWIGGLSAVVYYFLASPIVGAFIDEPSVIAYGTQMLRVQITSAPIIGIMFTVMSTMQATGRSMMAFLLAVCRQGLTFLPSLVILNHFFGFSGLIWAQPTADLAAIIVSLTVFGRLSKTLSALEAQNPLYPV